jgi:CheY-like chemotaxis protein
MLVVDDHRNTRESLALGLAPLDVEVETAGSGLDALRHLAVRACDWILCDVRMPGMTGIELAERARAASPASRVILMTAYDVSPDERRRIAELGADLLIKPVTADLIAVRCRLSPALPSAQPAPRRAVAVASAKAGHAQNQMEESPDATHNRQD